MSQRPMDVYSEAHVQTSSALALVACIISIILCSVHLHMYFFHNKRHNLVMFLNDIAAGAAVVQLLESIARGIFAAIQLFHPISAVGCNASATIDQFFDPAAQVYSIEFFIILAFLRDFSVKRSRKKIGYHLLPIVCGTLSASILWLALRDAETEVGEGAHFSAHLPWCWIPPEQKDATHTTDNELIVLRFFCLYIYYIVMLLAAVFALYRLACVESRGGDWSSTLRNNVVIRFGGVALFPLVAYTIGFTNRVALHDKSIAILHLVSFLYPLMGAANSLAFLASENLLPIVFLCKSDHNPEGLTGSLNFIGNMTLLGDCVPSHDSMKRSSSYFTHEEPTAQNVHRHNTNETNRQHQQHTTSVRSTESATVMQWDAQVTAARREDVVTNPKKKKGKPHKTMHVASAGTSLRHVASREALAHHHGSERSRAEELGYGTTRNTMELPSDPNSDCSIGDSARMMPPPEDGAREA